MNPLVSIIIPVYNSGSCLAETINSAINQTWSPKEIIIVDDGSTDNSFAIAQSYTDPAIKLFKQQNRGASAARNKGLAEASGKYIQFLDGDDLLSPDKISTQVALLEQAPGKIATCSTVHFQSGAFSDELQPSPYEDSFVLNDDDPIHFLINLWGGFNGNGSMIAVHSWLTPRNIIDKAGLWNERLTVDDDGEFFCRVILNSGGIIKAEGVFNYYRKHVKNSNLSGGRDIRSLTSQLNSALSKKKELLSRCNSKEARQAINRQLYDVFIFSYPAWPQIYKIAERDLVGNTKDDRPSLGGKEINMIAGIFGIKMALRVRHLIRPNRL